MSAAVLVVEVVRVTLTSRGSISTRRSSSDIEPEWIVLAMIFVCRHLIETAAKTTAAAVASGVNAESATHGSKMALRTQTASEDCPSF